MTRTVEDLVRDARAAVTEIDVARASALLGEGAVLIDVREPGEVAQGGIEGAINIPRGLLEWKIGGVSQIADPAQPIIVFCQSGGRSALSAVQLGALGYSNVMSMAGGYSAWTAADD